MNEAKKGYRFAVSRLTQEERDKYETEQADFHANEVPTRPPELDMQNEDPASDEAEG